jgi:hypothetical protein
MKRSLQELRQAIGTIANAQVPADRVVPTGWESLALACGRVTEIAGAWSSGKLAIAFGAAARATAEQKLVAWIDARGELYPPAAAARGVRLDRLLVVRPPATQISRAVEIVGRSRSFALIVVDVPDGVRIDDAAAARLRAAAHGSAAAVVALVSDRRSGVAHAFARFAIRRVEEGVRVETHGRSFVLPGFWSGTPALPELGPVVLRRRA